MPKGNKYNAESYRRTRGARNAASADLAQNAHQPWTQYEDDMLREFWLTFDGQRAVRQEREVAEAIGRSIEACRLRAHYLRSGKTPGYTTRTTRTVTRTTTVTETTETRPARRPQWMDDEGLPDWYV